MSSTQHSHSQLLRRRFFVFEAATLTLKYFDSEASAARPAAAKGEIVLDPADLLAVATEEHQKPHELRISSKGQALYVAADTAAAATALLQHLDVARRSLIAGDNGEALIKVADAEKDLNASVQSGDQSVKSFTWGVGPMLGVGNNKVQGMAFPQRVQALSSK